MCSLACLRQPRRFLVAPAPVQDLLFRAKDLFVAANVAGIALRRALARFVHPLDAAQGVPRAH